MEVLSAWLPKPRLLGVAERLGEPGVGVGLGFGVGVGVAEPPAVFVPPQPIAVKTKITSTKKRPACMVVYVLLRTVTPHSGNFRHLVLIWS